MDNPRSAPLPTSIEPAAVIAGVGDRPVELGQGFVEQKGGRDHSLSPGRDNPFKLPIEDSGKLMQTCQIGSCVRIVRPSRVLGIEEARDIEIGPDILDHHIGRIAPAADSDIAIGQGKAVERNREGAFDHCQAGPRCRIERAGIDLADLVQTFAQQGSDLGLSGSRPVSQHRAQARVLALVDPQRGRTFRIESDHLPGQLVKIGRGIGRGRGAERALTASKGQGGRSGPEQGKGLAAGKADLVHMQQPAAGCPPSQFAGLRTTWR